MTSRSLCKEALWGFGPIRPNNVPPAITGKRTYAKKENPYLTEDSEKMIDRLHRFLREHGPSRGKEIGRHFEHTEWNKVKQMIILATNYIPIWEEDGVYGVLEDSDGS